VSQVHQSTSLSTVCVIKTSRDVFRENNDDFPRFWLLKSATGSKNHSSWHRK